MPVIYGSCGFNIPFAHTANDKMVLMKGLREQFNWWIPKSSAVLISGLKPGDKRPGLEVPSSFVNVFL
jgi:hypothetical protein